MAKEWTKEQWQEWHKLVEWSHKAAHEGAKKLLEHIGENANKVSYLKFINIEEDIGHSIRRGAIRMLNQLNKIEESESGGMW